MTEQNLLSETQDPSIQSDPMPPEASERVPDECQAILVEGLYSMEYYQDRFQLEKISQVLQDISFEIEAGACWVFVSPRAFALKLLLDIVANTKPYQKGRCVLAKKGMMRKKCIILPHLFYIASTNMMYNNMTVLEYLTFVCSQSAEGDIARQLRLLQELVDLGLDFIALTLIDDLTAPEKAVLLLLVASYSDSSLILWNLPRLSYEPRLLRAIAHIVKDLQSRSVSLLFSTMDYELAQCIASHILVLEAGKVSYAGDIQTFTHERDSLAFRFTGHSREELVSVQKKLQACYDIRLEERGLAVYGAVHLPTLLQEMEHLGFCPTQVLRNTPNVANALKEIWSAYDI